MKRKILNWLGYNTYTLAKMKWVNKNVCAFTFRMNNWEIEVIRGERTYTNVPKNIHQFISSIGFNTAFWHLRVVTFYDRNAEFTYERYVNSITMNFPLPKDFKPI